MKTKNNVQKAILRSAAVIVSFVLISFTVSAQNFWKRLLENSSFNDIAIAMVDAPAKTNTTTESLKAINYNTEIEPQLEVEAWMTDYSNFDVNLYSYEEETDAELGLESWMLNEDLFQADEEEEDALELEAWMTSSAVWSI
ncbi:hypothetical protein [uncultured Draconibacterium sp.]|uniref:hypothetical protein n=1 Tax=uncultured Draconibacterium sp. TaxID=1573823 RepID=UPI003216219C